MGVISLRPGAKFFSKGIDKNKFMVYNESIK